MKNKKEYDLLEYLRKFINESRKGKRLQKNGKRIAAGTIENYETLNRLLGNFCKEKTFVLRIRPVDKLSKRELIAEKNYWKKFYKKFTDYLYDDLDHFDNHVGSQIKLLRSFFNHLNNEMMINTGTFHRLFYVRYEQKQIIVLTPERLNYLIHSTDFDNKLPPRLMIIKDIFIFGCTVALRISDIMKISPHDFEKINDTLYLSSLSQKTQTFVRVRLPGYIIQIVEKYNKKKNQRTLFPYYHKVYLNKYIKELR